MKKLLCFTFISLVVFMMLASGCSKSPTDPDSVATPVISPAAGTFTSPQIVTISCATIGATILYTTDGSSPSASSTVYSGPINVTSTTTLKAKAIKHGKIDSAIASATYSIFFDPGEMIFVPGGTFNNGTSDVTVSSFYIDKYEMTQAGYQAVMGVNPASFTTVTDGPVEQVTWFNAVEYCNRRSLLEGLTPCYNYGDNGTNPDNWPAGWNTDYTNHSNVHCDWTANGYRLPTEMEWMYAARGGGQTQNYYYSGSDDIYDVAWFTGNSGNTTHSVGTKAANELGLYDMSGNVLEWVWDIHGSYPTGSQNNPTGATSGSFRVYRGGCWLSYDHGCTVSFRDYSSALYNLWYFGFRISRISP